MVPAASSSGEFIVTLDSVWGQYYASVFQGACGIAVEDTGYPDHILYAYGKALGQLHVLSSEYSPKTRKWTYLDALLWSRKVLEEYHAPDKMLAELESVRQALNELPQTCDSFGLVHYDFEPDNVFWDESRQCCTAIDFEDGMYHFFLVDLEQALDALSEDIPADRRFIARQTFLQGYQSEKAVEPDFEEKRKLMRRFCNLYSYAGLVRCTAEKSSSEPDWMVRLRERLRCKMELLENGVPK